MIVESQRRLAAEILGVGKNRIIFDKNKIEDIKKAITRFDIKELIKEGTIKVKIRKKAEAKKTERGRGTGSRRMRVTRRKERYVKKIRKLRKYIQEIYDKKVIDNKEKKHLRTMAKAGELRSLRHLQDHLIGMNKKLPEKNEKVTQGSVQKKKAK